MDLWVMVYHGLPHHGDIGKPVGNNPHLCTHTCEGMVCTGVGVVLTRKTHGNTMIYPSCYQKDAIVNDID
jgi:hypothetical protein